MDTACVELFKTAPRLKGRVGHQMKREAIVGASGNAVVSSCAEMNEGMKRIVGDERQSGMRAIGDKGRLYFSLME